MGRFELLEPIGQGGMGAVYAAYDPELDRPVAIKVLHPRSSQHRPGEPEGAGGVTPAAKQRMLREARALARLSHPNVVHVYEVGEHGDSVYIAMEFVEGASLAEHCRRAPRPSWRDVLGLYLDAARGLAAAHRKGLVHRDIKPANILVSDEGRVLVADFGLALDRSLQPDPGADEAPADDSARPATKLAHERPITGRTPSSHERLTLTGALLGTPAYMAPEQHTGADVGPLADQYSFCVSLFEGVYGTWPFAIDSSRPDYLARLVADKLAERIIVPETAPETAEDSELDDRAPGEERPADAVPGWLYRTLRRGLRADAGQRYPDMAALVAALERGASDAALVERGPRPAPRPRRWPLISASLVALAAAAAIAALWWQSASESGTHHAAAACPDAHQELRGIWTAERRAAVQRAWTQLGVAPEAFARFSDEMTTYAEGWADARNSSCAATRVQGTQSDAMYQLRERCYRLHYHWLRAALHTALTLRDTSAVTRLSAAHRIRELQSCVAPKHLTALSPLPVEAGARQQIDEVYARLAEAGTLKNIGEFDLAWQRVEPQIARAEASGHPPLVALALSEAGILCNIRGELDRAEALYREALVAAAKGRDDRLTALIWIELITLLAVYKDSNDEALQLLPAAEVAVERVDDDRLRARFAASQAEIRLKNGDAAQAQALYEEAIVRWRRAGVDEVHIAEAVRGLGNVYKERGDHRQAVVQYRATLDVYERAYGVEHPVYAAVLVSLGIALNELGEHENALNSLQRALPVWTAKAPNNPDIPAVYLALGSSYLGLERIDEGLAHMRKALQLSDRGDATKWRARARMVLADGLINRAGRRAEAIALARTAWQLATAAGDDMRRARIEAWLSDHGVASDERSGARPHSGGKSESK